jgi:hypothetical protein
MAGARRTYVRWSEALGRALCARLAGGELLYRVCAEPGMPTPEAVAKWAKAKPAFREALLAARRAGGRPAGSRGPVFSYTDEVGEEIFERLCEGESLTRIARDPTMPSLKTLWYWRRHVRGFEELLAAGRRIQADMFCDRGWELAEAATPKTAYLTEVRLKQLRWMAGVMAPKAYRTKPVEPEATEEPMRVIWRHFKVEEDAETGERRMVVYVPDPDTGGIRREDEPGYAPPRGLMMPGAMTRGPAG